MLGVEDAVRLVLALPPEAHAIAAPLWRRYIATRCVVGYNHRSST